MKYSPIAAFLGKSIRWKVNRFYCHIFATTCPTFSQIARLHSIVVLVHGYLAELLFDRRCDFALMPAK
jgi:hypothetical protein